MSRRIVTTLLVLASVGVLVLAFALPPRIGHPVTPLMQSAADETAGKAINSLPSDATRPMVVVFVLPDCPCSIAYEPYVQALYRQHGAEAAFVEVVAGDASSAEEWKQQHRTPFEVVSDPDRIIAREFGALRSAYTALVLNGRVVRLWPGYSAAMLLEADRLLPSQMTEVRSTLDLDGAPEQPTSGCPL
jgi:hypothetical protein